MSYRTPRPEQLKKPCVRCHAVDRLPSGDCRPCAYARKAAWQKVHQPRSRAHNDKWRREHPEAARNSTRKAGLRYNFDLTIEEYDMRLLSQGGVCAICGEPPEKRRLAVDHDRKCCPGDRSCGKCIRGLLHDVCNRGLGYFRDDPVRLTAAAEYLRRCVLSPE